MERYDDGAVEPLINNENKSPFFDGIDLIPMAKVLEETSEYRIEGSDFSQILQINLKPGELLTCEPGSMVMTSEDASPRVDTGGLSQACTRLCCAGESFFRLHFENRTRQDQFVCLTPVGPGKIIPIDLSLYSGITIAKGSFLAAFGKNWRIKIQAVKGAEVACCGGQGIFKSKLFGNRIAFITAIGTIEELKLQANQTVVVNQECVLAFERSVDFDVRSLGCSYVCCCGGMGMYQATLTGPGTVWINTLPMTRLRRSLKLPSNEASRAANTSGGDQPGNQYGST